MKSAVLDAGVAIGFLDSADAHFDDAHDALERLVGEGASIYMSTVTLAEVLVEPVKMGDARVREVLADLNDYLSVEYVGIDSVALELAATRARHPGLKLPDAAVVVAAKTVRAGSILTTDRDFDDIDSAIRLRDFISR